MQVELPAGLPVAERPAAPSAPRAGAHARLLHELSRRWTLIRAVERASFGWAAGLALAAGWIAQNGGGAFIMLLPVFVAAVAAAWGWRNVPIFAAADRLDRTYDTHELFGTAARVRGGPDGAWLATQADEVAAGLSAADVPLARLHRWWWGTLFLATAAMALLAAGSPGAIDSVAPTADARFAARGALLSSDDGQDVPPTAGSGDAGATRSHDADVSSAWHSAIAPTSSDLAAPAGTSDREQRAADAEAGNSAAHAAGPGAASSTGASDSMPAFTFQEPKQPPGSAPDGGEAGSAITSGRSAEMAAGDDYHDAPAHSAAPRPEAAPASPGDATAAPDGATEKLHERRVPPRYRELVRRYFAGEQD